MSLRRPGQPRWWVARVLGVAALSISGTGIAVVLNQPAPPAAASNRLANPNRVDIGFCQDMIVHHYQAVLMSQEVLIRASPEIRAIADSVLTNQLEEIGWMQGALALWQAPAASRRPMAWMSSGIGMSGMTVPTYMPGLATQAELNRLAHLRGRALDVLFLQLMVRHHEGGIEMARYAAAHARVVAVRSLALRMDLEEAQEIETMDALLRADHASTLPYPNRRAAQ